MVLAIVFSCGFVTAIHFHQPGEEPRSPQLHKLILRKDDLQNQVSEVEVGLRQNESIRKSRMHEFNKLEASYKSKILLLKNFDSVLFKPLVNASILQLENELGDIVDTRDRGIEILNDIEAKLRVRLSRIRPRLFSIEQEIRLLEPSSMKNSY